MWLAVLACNRSMQSWHGCPQGGPNLAEDGVLVVQGVQVSGQGDEELARIHVLTRTCNNARQDVCSKPDCTLTIVQACMHAIVTGHR